MRGRTAAVLRALLRLMLFASTAIQIVFTIAATTVFSQGFFESALTGDDYIAEIKAQCETDVAVTARITAFPSDYIETLIDIDTLRELSCRYAENVYTALMSGDETICIEYPLEKLMSAINAADSDDALDKALYPSEQARMTLAEKFKTAIDFRINSFAQKNINRIIGGIVNKDLIFGRSSVEIFTVCTAVISAALTALLFSLTLVGSRERFFGRLYGTGGAILCGSALIAVPMTILGCYGIAGRIPLADSPLKSFLKAVTDCFTWRATAIAAVFTAVGAAMLIVGAVAIAIKRGNKNTKKNEVDDENTV